MNARGLLSFGIAVMAAPASGLLATLAVRAEADDQEFRPVIEAKMPAGFSTHTGVEEIRVKRYPAYRKAQADSTGGTAFWTLFSHIKQNDIAMTAPVEMSYSDGDTPGEATMAFLYGRDDMGSTGREGKVDVIDVPAMTVASTGVRGPRTAESVAEAKERLEQWLQANQDRYSAAGPMRVMAYNSPFVPRHRNYYEVEIPLRGVEPSAPSTIVSNR